MENVVLNIF